MTILKVSVKWSGKKFDDVPLDVTKPARDFKEQLYKLTQVEPEKQKIMIKGGMLKDDTDLTALNVPNGHVFMMMGTPGAQIPKEPVEKPKFLEDMSTSQRNTALMIPAGLTNLGNTCYMNATLQCLRSIPELGTSLQKDLQGTFGIDRSKNLTVALRDLMRQLNDGGAEINPLIFLQTLRAQYDQFAQQVNGSFAQQDADECYSALITNLDSNFKLPGGSSFVEKYMTGTFEKTMKCDEAPEEAPVVTHEEFRKLRCHISVNVNYLSQGLEEALNEKIEKNSPTLNRTAIYSMTSKVSKLPKYLTVSFVRFFWKQDIRKKAKIMRAVKYPFDLDLNSLCTPELQEKMRPFRDLLMKQTLAKDDAAKQQRKERPAETVKVSAKDLGIELKETLRGKVDEYLYNEEGINTTANYELVSVLTHVGRSADSGHYMAWVKGREYMDEWWKFDDDKVSPVKGEDIEKLYGGGDWHMAYMLVYKAKTLE